MVFTTPHTSLRRGVTKCGVLTACIIVADMSTRVTPRRWTNRCYERGRERRGVATAGRDQRIDQILLLRAATGRLRRWLTAGPWRSVSAPLSPNRRRVSEGGSGHWRTLPERPPFGNGAWEPPLKSAVANPGTPICTAHHFHFATA